MTNEVEVEVEEARRYTERLLKALEIVSDAERIEVLTDKVQFWCIAAQQWHNAFKSANEDRGDE